eukprot:6688482-Alexandrium_andersonii.AAC.1
MSRWLMQQQLARVSSLPCSSHSGLQLAVDETETVLNAAAGDRGMQHLIMLHGKLLTARSGVAQSQ